MGDNRVRYGGVTRFLHWGIALLLLWQFTSVSAHFFWADSAFEQWIWPTHKPLGFVLCSLAIVRLLWAIMNASRRPPSISFFAKLGHLALYLLVIVVPGLALLRQYGSGRTFEPFGIPLMTGHSDKITWMTDLGSALHSTLGWVLLALIIGHILMAIAHKHLGSSDDVMPRMWR